MNTDRPTPDPSDPDPARGAGGDDLRRRVSAAADGDARALDHACQDWRQGGAAREAWHTYHLIGDVLRSPELASRPAHDAAFLQALRARLETEPVLLAPTPVPIPTPAVARATPRWWAPAAAAAGVAAVAGVLVVSRLSAPETPAGLIAAAPASSARVLAPTRPADAQIIRDAQLDSYLQAHQAARGGMGAAVPGSALRRVDLDLPAGAAK